MCSRTYSVNLVRLSVPKKGRWGNEDVGDGVGGVVSIGSVARYKHQKDDR